MQDTGNLSIWKPHNNASVFCAKSNQIFPICIYLIINSAIWHSCGFNTFNDLSSCGQAEIDPARNRINAKLSQ